MKLCRTTTSISSKIWQLHCTVFTTRPKIARLAKERAPVYLWPTYVNGLKEKVLYSSCKPVQCHYSFAPLGDKPILNKYIESVLCFFSVAFKGKLWRFVLAVHNNRILNGPE